MKYKMKEYFVEAMQYDGTNSCKREIHEFCGDYFHTPVGGTPFVACHGFTKQVFKSDYVVKNSNGQIRVLNKSNFEDCYEVVKGLENECDNEDKPSI